MGKQHHWFQEVNGRLLYIPWEIDHNNHCFFLSSCTSRFHESPMGGPSRDYKTYKRTCSPSGLLQPLTLLAVWVILTMGFIGGLRLPKELTLYWLWWTGYASKHIFCDGSIQFPGLFVMEVVHLHGFPFSTIFDRDRVLMSTFRQDFTYKEVRCEAQKKCNLSSSNWWTKWECWHELGNLSVIRATFSMVNPIRGLSGCLGQILSSHFH